MDRAQRFFLFMDQQLFLSLIHLQIVAQTSQGFLLHLGKHVDLILIGRHRNALGLARGDNLFQPGAFAKRGFQGLTQG